MEYSSSNPMWISQGNGSRSTPPPSSKLFFIDLFLRLLLMASSLAATVVIRTGKQTALFNNPLTFPQELQVKWSHSPAFIYFLSALSFSTSYGATTALNIIFRPRQSLSNVFLFYTGLLDTLAFGIMASATGAASAVAYIELKGNEYVGWVQICSIFDKFCTHICISVGLSLFASVLLLLLVMLNAYSAHRQIQNQC